MTPAPLRSFLFNISFYSMTLICCILFLPTLLMPRRWYLVANKIWHDLILFLEYYILGLRYEVRGAEYLPEDTAFIIAAKHMSPYETLKLRLLFDDPAIILKKELLRIPLWGWYLKKSDVIAIDRSTPDEAIASIERGARRMKARGRPIVIFPQGTRVEPHETPKEKRYRSGIYHVQKATNLPVIPMATNSGLYWPRSGWLKTPGTVVFEFLPAIGPGKTKAELLGLLEDKLERASNRLVEDAITQENTKKTQRSILTFLFTLVFLAGCLGVYTYLWQRTAQEGRVIYQNTMQELSTGPYKPARLAVSGYPGPVTFKTTQDRLSMPEGTVVLNDIRIQTWPLPLLPVIVSAGPVEIQSYKWATPLIFDSVTGRVRVLKEKLVIKDSLLKKEDFSASFDGYIALDREPVPDLELNMSLENYNDFLITLAEKDILEKRMALFIASGFNALSDKDGVVRVPLTIRNQRIYAGPLPVASLPVSRRPAHGNRPGPAR